MVLLPLVAALLAAAAVPPLKLAVPDPLGAEQAKKDVAAIAALLSQKLGRAVEGQVAAAADIPALVAQGKVDVAWLSASEYVRAAQQGPVQPLSRLVRNGLPFYRSVIFTRKAGGAAVLADLKGKKIALVSNTSAAGYVLPIVMLHAAHATDPVLLGNHAAVCKAVLDGSADAGATFGNDKGGKTGIDGCAEAIGERTAELRVLAASTPIPNDVVAARPELPPADVEPLRLVLDQLGDSPEGKALLDGVFHAERFLAASDDDFILFRHALAEAGESP
jgi:phosphonate transport system substrate-binding protein